MATNLNKVDLVRHELSKEAFMCPAEETHE